MGETPMLLSGRAAGFPAFDGLGVALVWPLNTVAMKAEQPHVVPCVAFAPPVQRLNMVNSWRFEFNPPKRITRISSQRCAAAHLANVPVSLEHGCRFDLRVVGDAIPLASAAVVAPPLSIEHPRRKLAACLRRYVAAFLDASVAAFFEASFAAQQELRKIPGLEPIAQLARQRTRLAFRQSVARNRTVFTKRAAAVFSESGPARFAYLACPSRIRRPPASRRAMHLRFACPVVHGKSKRLATPDASQRRMIDPAWAGRIVAASAQTALAKLPARFTFSLALLAACRPVPAAARLAPRGARPSLRPRE